MLKTWRSTPWKKDLSLWDCVAILAGATLSLVHHGLTTLRIVIEAIGPL